MKKIDKFADKDNWQSWIGKEIIKYSQKPFKNGKQINIVVSMKTNPNSNKIGFEVEDGSIVDCHQCKLFN